MSVASDADRPQRRDVLWICVICLVPSAVFFLDVGLQNPAYLRDYRKNANPDAVHYVLLGRNVLEKGLYSRQREDEQPYLPDMLRTPVYPLIAGGLDLLLGTWAIYVFHTLCRTATALAVYWCCCPLFGRRIARIAGLLLAADLMLTILDFETMSEPLFDLLATLAVLLWLQDLFHPTGQQPRLRRGILIGLLLGLAALTRPTGLYLAIGLGGIELVLAGMRRSGAVLKHGVALASVAVLLVLPWIIRNYQIFGIARLTTADRLTLVFDAGAGAYSVEHGLETKEARERIHTEFGVVSFLEGNNHWLKYRTVPAAAASTAGLLASPGGEGSLLAASVLLPGRVADRSVKDMDDELKVIEWEVLRKYPRSLLIATGGGLARAAFSHNVDTYATLTQRTWNRPGMGNLLRGQIGTFLAELFTNHVLLVGLFVWQIVFAVFTLGMAVVGLMLGLWRREWRGPVFCMVLVMGYYTLTIAAVGLPAYARYRAMLVPFLCVLTALGVSRFVGVAPNSSPVSGNKE